MGNKPYAGQTAQQTFLRLYPRTVRDGFEASLHLAMTPFKRMWTRAGAMN